MTRIIVRAADTALAMDEVLERLGTGAFILSTRSEPGGVVIEAATDPVAAEREAVVTSFADELSARLRGQPEQAPPEPAAEADHDDAWIHAVAAAFQQGQIGQLAELHALFDDDGNAWPTDRLVLFGPVTEELVLTAVRLAVAFRQSDATCRPELVSCGRQRSLPVAPLQAWAQLLGLPHRLLPPEAGRMPTSDAPQIVVVSNDSGVDPCNLARSVADLLMVLPSGLHPRKLDRLLSPWEGTPIGVCLSGLSEDDPPQPAELRRLAKHAAKLRVTGWGNETIDALITADAPQLEAWAHHWIAELQSRTTEEFPKERVA